MDPLSIAASIAGLLQAVAATCKAVKTIKKLPKAFEHVDKHLPLVQRTLNDVQTRLNRRVLADEERQSINKILEGCLINAQHLKQIFVALEQKCNKDKDSKNWDKLRGWYNTTLQSAKGYRVESLMTDILKDLKQLSLYESFALATREDIEEIRKALDDLSQVESAMEDSGSNQGTSVSNSQNVALGGHGQQNTPLGGHNTFNSGYNISGGQVNIVTRSAEQSFAHTLIPAGIPHPQGAIKRIRAQKGKVLKTCYEWIFSNDDFKRWRYGDDSRLLWIRGDPGKGKTMLLCGIIETFEHVKSLDDQARIPIYFFCQATDGQLNTAESVMQGLLAFLIDKSPSPRSKYIDSNSTYRADWDMLVQKVEDVLRDLDEEGVYLIVDALDECVDGREKLLKAIVELSESTLQRVKILVSSRNLSDIKDELNCSELIIDLSLERNKSSVGDAIGFFIANQVTVLAKRKQYSDDLRETIRQYLESNSRGTFLWVALVCKELAKCKLVDSAYDMLKSKFPPELNGIYGRMVEIINHSSENPGLCKQILAIACAVFRPVSWCEMKSLLGSTTRNNLASIIGLCGSFLSIQDDGGTKDDDKIINFVHLSAKDFLLENQDASRQIMPHGLIHQHYHISQTSLTNLSTVLRRDIYGLRDPGFLVEAVTAPEPDHLASLRYSCTYWPNHVLNMEDSKALTTLPEGIIDISLSSDPNARNFNEMIKDNGVVHRFIEEKYLYWLEALSLLSELSEGVKAIERLALFVRHRTSPELYNLIDDARRFILLAKRGIEIAPLQVYASALIFSPTNSLIRKAFHREYPSWIQQLPIVKQNWDARLQIFELSGMSGSWGISVAFSNDDRQLFVYGGDDYTITAFDPTTGNEIRKLEGHNGYVSSIVFSSDGKRMASCSVDTTIKLWDISSGDCTQTLSGHADEVVAASFSRCSQKIASASQKGPIKIWNINSAECTHTFKSSRIDHWKCEMAWSSSGHNLLVVRRKAIDRWNINSRTRERLIELNLGSLGHFAISNDGQKVASTSGENIEIWDVSSGDCTMTLKSHDIRISHLAFSKDGSRLGLCSWYEVKIWELNTGVRLHELEHQRSFFSSFDFSNNGQRVITGHEAGRITTWDPDTTLKNSGHIEDYLPPTSFLTWSSDGLRVASGSQHGTVTIWEANSGTCLRRMNCCDGPISSLDLSSTGHRMAISMLPIGILENDSAVWDVTSGEFLLEFPNKSNASVLLSSDGQRVALGTEEVEIWDVSSGDYVLKCEGISGFLLSGHVMSCNGQFLAVSMDDGKTSVVKEWDIHSGICTRTIYKENLVRNLSYCPDKSSWLTWDSDNDEPDLEISEDQEWIMQDGKDLIWLPHEYRPENIGAVAAVRSKIAIGSVAGRVLIVGVSEMAGRR